MTSFIDYKDTLFDQANLTPIYGKLTFETLHKLQNKIKDNAKFFYSNIGGGAHGNIGLVLANAQYALILNIPFVYPTQPSPLIIQERKSPTRTQN